jgi:hypothetical protein
MPHLWVVVAQHALGIHSTFQWLRPCQRRLEAKRMVIWRPLVKQQRQKTATRRPIDGGRGLPCAPGLAVGSNHIAV